MTPRDLLLLFDDFLEARGLRLDAVVVGGAALNLLGFVQRPTKDCDILHPELPPAVTSAARAFASTQRAAGLVLDDDWLNNGPASLTALLPVGWMDRLQPAFDGRAIRLRSLGRADLLCTKLFALCDRGFDLGDCVALAPSAHELDQVRPWLEQQDGHPGWPAHVRATLDDLGQRLGHGV